MAYFATIAHSRNSKMYKYEYMDISRSYTKRYSAHSQTVTVAKVRSHTPHLALTGELCGVFRGESFKEHAMTAIYRKRTLWVQIYVMERTPRTHEHERILNVSLPSYSIFIFSLSLSVHDNDNLMECVCVRKINLHLHVCKINIQSLKYNLILFVNKHNDTKYVQTVRVWYLSAIFKTCAFS